MPVNKLILINMPVNKLILINMPVNKLILINMPVNKLILIKMQVRKLILIHNRTYCSRDGNYGDLMDVGLPPASPSEKDVDVQVIIMEWKSATIVYDSIASKQIWKRNLILILIYILL